MAFSREGRRIWEEARAAFRKNNDVLKDQDEARDEELAKEIRLRQFQENWDPITEDELQKQLAKVDVLFDAEEIATLRQEMQDRFQGVTDEQMARTLTENSQDVNGLIRRSVEGLLRDRITEMKLKQYRAYARDVLEATLPSMLKAEAERFVDRWYRAHKDGGLPVMLQTDRLSRKIPGRLEWLLDTSNARIYQQPYSDRQRYLYNVKKAAQTEVELYLRRIYPRESWPD